MSNTGWGHYHLLCCHPIWGRVRYVGGGKEIQINYVSPYNVTFVLLLVEFMFILCYIKLCMLYYCCTTTSDDLTGWRLVPSWETNAFPFFNLPRLLANISLTKHIHYSIATTEENLKLKLFCWLCMWQWMVLPLQWNDDLSRVSSWLSSTAVKGSSRSCDPSSPINQTHDGLFFF